jgi:hypothetical protein
MLFNVAIDSLLGAIPFVGDLFDFAWKANTRNLALLERHAEVETRASASDWLFVTVLILIVIALAAIPFVIAAWALAAIGRQLF